MQKAYIFWFKEIFFLVDFFNDKAICKHLVSACMNDDVELYGLIQKSNKFKFLRRRLIRPLDDIIEVNNEVVDNIEPQEVIGDTATNDIVTDVTTKVVKVTKAFIVVKNVLTIGGLVVEVIANKRGRHTLAEAALKLDKLQQTLPIIAKRSCTRNKKQHENILNIIFFIFFIMRTSHVYIVGYKLFLVCFGLNFPLFCNKN